MSEYFQFAMVKNVLTWKWLPSIELTILLAIIGNLWPHLSGNIIKFQIKVEDEGDFMEESDERTVEGEDFFAVSF